MTLRNELSVNLGLPQTSLASTPELRNELQRVYGAIRALARAVDTYTGALNEETEYWEQTEFSRCYIGLNSRIYLEAGEDIPAGYLVGVKSDNKVWLGKPGTVDCIGFATVATLTGNTVEVQLQGMYPQLPAGTLVAGQKYFCSPATPGTLSISGSHPVGIALSDTQLYINPQL